MHLIKFNKGGLNLDDIKSDQEPTEVWFTKHGQDFQRTKEFLTIRIQET